MLPIYNLELSVSNVLLESWPLECLGHQTKCLPGGPVEHVDEVVLSSLHAIFFVGADGLVKLRSLHLVDVHLMLHINTKIKQLCSFVQNFL